MRTHSAGLHHKSGAAASAARVERARARVTRRHYGWLAYRGMAPVYLLLLVALTLWMGLLLEERTLPALRRLCRAAQMTEDAAGATVLALATGGFEVLFFCHPASHERRDQSGAPFLFARRVRRPFLAAIEAACEHAIALAERDEEAEARADERARDASRAVGSAAPPGAEVRPPPLERQGAAVRSGGPMLRAERSARRWPQPAELLAAADGDDGRAGQHDDESRD